MQIFFRTLFAIYLGHLLTDFLFQTPRLMDQKRRGKLRGYLVHGLAHFLATLALTAFFVRGSALSARTYLVLLALTLLHLLIDFAKIRLTQRELIPDATTTYIADQILHLVAIVFAAWLLSPGVAFRDLTALVGASRNLSTKLLAVPVVYIAVVFGGGYLIRYLTRSLAEGIRTHSPERSSQQLQNAGLYIGWLERFLVVTALLLQSPATIGLILTAKAIARYPEFKSEHFAEYFLIGTLLSIAIALLGGIILAKVLFGVVQLA
jgi:VanZ family protein